MKPDEQLAADLDRSRQQVAFLVANCPNSDCPIGCPDSHADVGFPEINCGTFRPTCQALLRLDSVEGWYVICRCEWQSRHHGDWRAAYEQWREHSGSPPDPSLPPWPRD